MPTTALLDVVTEDKTDDLFDLDLEIGVETITAGPAIKSWSICTPGCTSPGGGSNCSFCC